MTMHAMFYIENINRYNTNILVCSDKVFEQTFFLCREGLKGLLSKNEREYRVKPEYFRSWLRPIYEIYLMFLSQEIYIKLCQLITKLIYIWEWYENLRFNTDYIQQIRNESVSRDQIYALPLVEVLFTWYIHIN